MAKKECCPVCTLPMPKPAVKSIGTPAVAGCSFFARCHQLKLAETKSESDKLRSKLFRDFHADICPKCKLPKEECKKKRIQALHRKAVKDVKEKRRNSAYVQEQEIKDMLAAPSLCKPPKRNYTPVNPTWYSEF